MGKWLVGCSVVFLVVLVLLVLIGFFLFREMQEIGESVADAGSQLEKLDERYPFERPEGGLLEADRFARFLEARRLVAEEAQVFLDEMSEGSWIRKISTGFRGFQRMLPTFIAALEKAEISSAEYHFCGSEVMYALRYTEQPEVASRHPEFAGIREAHRELLRKLENIDFEGPWNYVFQIAPDRLAVPEPNVDLIGRNADALAATSKALLVEQFLQDQFLERAKKEGAASRGDAGGETVPAGQGEPSAPGEGPGRGE
jgi:hypothetical protein